MTRSEFKQIGLDIFAELMSKAKSRDTQEFLGTFISELEDQGFEFEDDGDLDEATESEDEDFEG